MPSSNILLFDANKANMMADEQYNTNTQRLNGVQSGIASSQLQNKTLYQVSLVAYAIAQIMNQNGLDANDTAAVSAFVANLSGTMLQKVADLATTQEAQAGVATGKWMSPALVKTAIDTLAAKAQNILSSETKTAYGLGSDAVPDDVLSVLAKAALYDNGFKTIGGSSITIGNCRVWSTTYTGTGTNGLGFPSVNFPWPPTIAIVAGDDGMMILTRNTKQAAVATSTDNSRCFVQWSGNNVKWYSSGSNAGWSQLNQKGVKYTVVALGVL